MRFSLSFASRTFLSELIEKPFNVSDFIKNVQGLMVMADLHVLAQNSRKVSERFSVDKIVEEWYQLWNN